MMLISHFSFTLAITMAVHCPAWGTIILHPQQACMPNIFAYHYDAFRRLYTITLDAPNLENARSLSQGNPLIHALSGFGIGI